MFKHKGKTRTYSHNLRLASLLSTVAGIVNIVGVLSLHTLTTNITGHFAFFTEQLLLKQYAMAVTFMVYVIFFLSGAFASSLLMEWISKHHPRGSYVLPITIEAAILLAVGGSNLLPLTVSTYPEVLACLLLFSMGLQNAMVTRVSQSVVRTTHLTGLFTDLGIELSQLFFYREREKRTVLRKSIVLKLMIIACFFLGGNIGGLVYSQVGISALWIAVGILLMALGYDHLLFRYYHIRRKWRSLAAHRASNSSQTHGSKT